MEFIIFFLLLSLMNFIVMKISNGIRKKWIISGIIFIICSPLVFFITASLFGSTVNSGFGGGIFGLICGLVTFLNGLVFLIKGLVTKSIKN